MAKARSRLVRFPGIDDPSVDQLRLFAGAEPVLALEQLCRNTSPHCAECPVALIARPR